MIANNVSVAICQLPICQFRSFGKTSSDTFIDLFMTEFNWVRKQRLLQKVSVTSSLLLKGIQKPKTGSSVECCKDHFNFFFCLQMTPDENFILDQHPHWKNIVVGAGFSGKHISI